MSNPRPLAPESEALPLGHRAPQLKQSVIMSTCEVLAFRLMLYHQLRSYGDGTLECSWGWIEYSALIQSVISVHVPVARS